MMTLCGLLLLEEILTKAINSHELKCFEWFDPLNQNTARLFFKKQENCRMQVAIGAVKKRYSFSV